MFDDLSGVEGTPQIEAIPSLFPIPLPTLTDGNTVTGNLAAAFGSTASVTAATPQYMGKMTVILSASFQSLTITMTQLKFGGSVTYTPNIQLTITSPAALPKTFAADLDRAAGNQNQHTRRINPGVSFPAQVFGGSLHELTAFEIHAQIESEGIDVDRTVFEPTPSFSVSAPPADSGGVAPAVDDSLASADIQLRTGDGALTDTRTLLAEPGDTVVVEFFATNFENALGAEPSFVFDDLSGVEGTPQIEATPSLFPIPLPTLTDGNTVTGNLAAAFGSTASVTAATPQYMGKMTVILSASFQSLTITLTQLKFGGSVTYTPNVRLTISRPSAGPASVEIQGNTVIARATAAQAVSGDLPLGRFLFSSNSGLQNAQITFTQVVFTAGARSDMLQPNLILTISPAVTDAPLVIRPPVPATITDTRVIIEGSFSKLGTVTVRYGTARDALDLTASSDGSVQDYQILIEGLTPETPYFFQATSTDDQDRTSLAAPPTPASFHTKKEDPNPPRVVQRPAAVDITTNSANILVRFDEGATVQVLYGTSADALDNTADSPTPNARFHRIPLTGLAAGAVFYRVRATDASDRTVEFPEAPETLSFTVRSEADTRPLRILGRPSVDRTSSGAIIGWVTNKFSDSAVFFGLSQADAEQFLSDNLAKQAQAAGALDSVTINESVREHGVTLVNLFSDTTVHYVTRSIDAGGNKVFSRLFNFTTGSGEEDNTAPRFVRAPITSRLTDTEATITFKLNESAVAAAQFATSMDVYADSTGEVGETVSIFTPSKRPDINLTNLESGTTYYYKLIVTDIAGNSATNPGQLSLITRPTADTRGPYVFSLPISTGVAQNSAIITWGADEKHTAVVNYEPVVVQTGATKQAASAGSVEVIKSSQRHAATISDLVSNTTYRFWVVTTDGSGNISESRTDDMLFTTALIDDIIPPTITAIPIATNITATSATIEWPTDEGSRIAGSAGVSPRTIRNS